MKYLLDTCLLSELVKPHPHPDVLRWIKRESEFHFAVSVLSLGEIHRGIIRLPHGKKREALDQWLRNDLIQRFGERCLSIDSNVVFLWSEFESLQEKSGLKNHDDIDLMIAATAKAHDLVLVTRNIGDFIGLPIEIFNPWES